MPIVQLTNIAISKDEKWAVSNRFSEFPFTCCDVLSSTWQKRQEALKGLVRDTLKVWKQ